MSDHRKREEPEKWHRLDNIGTMHSLCHTKRSTSVFRISVFLKHTVNVTVLQKAVDRIMERFPYYRVYLCHGFFWFYWQETKHKLKVMRDSRYPCEWMPLGLKKVFPIRVRAYKNSISCEFHHSITDGGGGIIFLKSLTAEYLALKGAELVTDKEVLNYGDPVLSGEYEDSFLPNYRKRFPVPDKKMDALRLPFKLLPKKKYHITTGIISSARLLREAKKHGVSLTEYVASVYLYSLQTLFQNQKRPRTGPLRIIIPINLRKIFESVTQRNFFLWTTPGIDTRLGYYEFEEILKNISHHMKITVDKKEILRQVKVNVGSQLDFFVRAMPLWLKVIVIHLIYSSLGEKKQSGVVTNLGLIKLPQAIAEEVDSFEFVPPPTPISKVSCGMISYGDITKITFGSLVREKEVERLFFTFLRKQGVQVKIETNYSEV